MLRALTAPYIAAWKRPYPPGLPVVVNTVIVIYFRHVFPSEATY